ncbi:efflux RND transporter periplasmic adaptor subunit [Parasediminibacterium sp. JCM 36343]|uniref:efflux RND transporter periplasmic adaptor subunit n=1 Tax=Parasediminibacterium sp. JCM 36343 TaxID=3374279 RepID=UPI00397B91CC
MKYIIYLFIIITLSQSCKSKQAQKPFRKDIVDAVFASGKAVSADEYKVTAFAEGYLNASLVSEGDSVKKGQPLFKLVNDIQQTQVQNALDNYTYAQDKLAVRAPQIQQMEEQISQAHQKKQIDSVNYARYQKLIKINAVAKVDYDKVLLDYKNDISTITQLEKSLADVKRSLSINEKNAKAQYQIQQQNNSFYTLVSASNGLILNIFKKNGDLVKKGEVVADLGTGKMIARLFVAEDDIQRVQLHQQVLISLNTDKNHVYNASISKIYSSFDESSQSFIVEATFAEKPANLKYGTQLQANLIVAEKKDALVIPTPYLFDGDSVMLMNSHRKIGIKTGIKTLEWIEVTQGLNGDEILEESKKQ